MKATIAQLATYIARDGARVHRVDGDVTIYRVLLSHGGHVDYALTPEQRAELWRMIEKQGTR